MRTGRPSKAQINDPDCWQLLANAIVAQAASDYYNALVRLRQNPEDYVSLWHKNDVEKFIRSDRFSLFTKTDGDFILRRLEKEAAGTHVKGKASHAGNEKEVWRMMDDSKSISSAGADAAG